MTDSLSYTMNGMTVTASLPYGSDLIAWSVDIDGADHWEGQDRSDNGALTWALRAGSLYEALTVALHDVMIWLSAEPDDSDLGSTLDQHGYRAQLKVA